MKQTTFISLEYFNDFGEDTKVKMECQHEDWKGIANTFYHFLLAQGYLVSEKALADYYQDRADEMGDLRSNIRMPKNPSYNTGGSIFHSQSMGTYGFDYGRWEDAISEYRASECCGRCG
jgi:hypothetical protein